MHSIDETDTLSQPEFFARLQELEGLIPAAPWVLVTNPDGSCGVASVSLGAWTGVQMLLSVEETFNDRQLHGGVSELRNAIHEMFESTVGGVPAPDPALLARLEWVDQALHRRPWVSLVEDRDFVSGSSFILTGDENSDRGPDLYVFARPFTRTIYDDLVAIQDFIALARTRLGDLIEMLRPRI